VFIICRHVLLMCLSNDAFSHFMALLHHSHRPPLFDHFYWYMPHQCRLIADVFADSGFLTVVPDYFQGEPMNIALLETYEALPSMSLLGKLGGYAQLAGQIVGMVSPAISRALVAN
jgi:hypothetical protein